MNTIPKDGVNPYADHPGYEQGACPLRYTVTHRGAYGAIGYAGFGCEMTGGHCLPGEHCEGRRKEADRQDEFRAMLSPVSGVRHMPDWDE